MSKNFIAPPPPGAPSRTAIAPSQYSLFITAYEKALSGKTIGKAQEVSNAVAYLTESAFDKFMVILNSSGMANPKIPEIIDLLVHLAMGPLKAKSKLPLASPLHVTGHMVRGYVSREIKASAKLTDTSAARKSRPASGSDYLKPQEADQLRELQGDYDFAFNTVGQAYAVAIIRALKLMQSLPDKVAVEDVRGRMLNTWYSKPEGVNNYWMAWLWIAGFDYTTVSNWMPDIPSPAFTGDPAQRDAITAVCHRLLRLDNWASGSLARCQRFLKLTIEIAGHAPSPLHAHVDTYRRCSGDISEVDKRAFAFVTETSSLLLRTQRGAITSDAFDAFRRDVFQLGIFDPARLDAYPDNMSGFLQMAHLPKYHLLRTLLGEAQTTATVTDENGEF
jgi:hypothetical protein